MRHVALRDDRCLQSMRPRSSWPRKLEAAASTGPTSFSCSPTTSFTSSNNAGGPPNLSIDDEESFSSDFRTTSGSTFSFHDPHEPHGTASAASAAASSNNADPNWNKTLEHKSTAMFGQNLLKTRGFEIDAFGIVSTPRGAFKRDESQRGSSR